MTSSLRRVRCYPSRRDMSLIDSEAVGGRVFGLGTVLAFQATVSGHPLSTDQIASVILKIRGQRVLLDAELARLYGVETKALNQAVRRNGDRFPADFMFQLTTEEQAGLRSQIVTLETGRGRHRKFRPYAFTAQGVAMLSSVLRSPRAIAVNIEIMRAFVGLRRTLESTAGLARKLDALERKYDGQLAHVFEAIRQLVAPAPGTSKKIGFK